MSFLFKVCNILVIFTIVECSFFNPYRQLRYYSDDDDPGEPLYLTEYIESGDIEKVHFYLCIYLIHFRQLLLHWMDFNTAFCSVSDAHVLFVCFVCSSRLLNFTELFN